MNTLLIATDGLLSSNSLVIAVRGLLDVEDDERDIGYSKRSIQQEDEDILLISSYMVNILRVV